MEHKNIAEKLGLMDPLSHDKFVDQELQGLSDDLVGPLMVAWDVTNRCNLKCMVEFFLLGRKVRTVEMLNYFADALNCLEGLHVVKRDGIDYVQLDELILISYQSCFFFVSTPYSFPHCISNTLKVQMN